MTPIDIKNREIIIDTIESSMGYDDESLEYFKNAIHKPFVDEAYSANMGADFRARWKLEDFSENNGITNKAWKLFCNKFEKISVFV